MFGDIEELFRALARSKFRSGFALKSREQNYLREKGFETIRDHARDFITNRLAPAHPPNDGKQTPMRNHPVFIAQHATGTCCRKCLMKCHKIPTGRELTDEQIEYVIAVIIHWLKLQEN